MNGCNESHNCNGSHPCGIVHSKNGSEIFDILKIDPEEFAKQITLKDITLFKAIQPDELTSCSWSGKSKLKRAPNIVASTRRFNQINFWVQKEVLAISNVISRAEILTHFIRIAKRLQDNQNLQSCRAILAGCQSAPIYRLSQTWSRISKKDKQIYDKLTDLFSEEDNRQNLRNHMKSIRLPCLPYLGLYLADLIFIDSAYPCSGGLESQARLDNMNNILRVIADFQESEYYFAPVECIQDYLDMEVCMEEFQSLAEDNNYNQSLQLEPPTIDKSSSGVSSNGSSIGDPTLPCNGGPVMQCLQLPLNQGEGMDQIIQEHFVPRHRKSRSLGASGILFPPNHPAGTNVHIASLGRSALAKRNLLDDSVLDASTITLKASAAHTLTVETSNGTQISPYNIPENLSPNDISLVSIPSPLTSPTPVSLLVPTSLADCTPLCQGCLKRKTIQKDGKKPAMPKWKRYWICLVQRSSSDRFLLYYRAKSHKAIHRSDFRNAPYKSQCVDGCLIMEPRENRPFITMVDALRNMYKFKVPNSSTQPSLQVWSDFLRTCYDIVGHNYTRDLIQLHDS